MSDTPKTTALTLYELGIILTPAIDPRISIPQSVLHLPAVINGIEKGEIIVEIVDHSILPTPNL